MTDAGFIAQVADAMDRRAANVWVPIVSQRMAKAPALAARVGCRVHEARAMLEALDEVKWRVFVLGRA